MAFLIIYVVFVVLNCFFISSYNNGVEGGRNLTKEEDLELEKQLKFLNKPPVKTIKTKYGDIYDCIDFYKQSAFDHPLLKNHTFHSQMRPTSVPEMTGKNSSSSINTDSINIIKLKGAGCPFGTVPIRRLTKDDLIRFKLHSKRYGSKSNLVTLDNSYTHYAVIRTKFNPNKKYYGGSASISIYNPSVSGFEYSSTRMKFQNQEDSIQVGWTVHPALYGDNHTRLYTYMSGASSRCFNTQCPGFVIVNTEIPLDWILEPVSERGGQNYYQRFSIFRDSTTSNWWLAIGPKNTVIGFWPPKIFNWLADFASVVEWGGETFSPPGYKSPPMGSGYFPSFDRELQYDAFCGMLTTINEANIVMDAANTEIFVDNKNLYGVINWGNVKGAYRSLMCYGGPER